MQQAESYIVSLRPRFYVPFAGTHTLAGKLSALNHNRGVPELNEAHDFLKRADSPIDPDRSRGCLLAAGGQIDLATGTCDSPYTPVDPAEKAHYVAEVLACRALDYEVCPPPVFDELLTLIPACYGRMDRKRRQLGFDTRTRALVTLGNGECVRLCLDGRGYDVVDDDIAKSDDAFVLLRTDLRLLLWLLKGPRYAHWDSAEIGSHARTSNSSGSPSDLPRDVLFPRVNAPSATQSPCWQTQSRDYASHTRLRSFPDGDSSKRGVTSNRTSIGDSKKPRTPSTIRRPCSEVHSWLGTTRTITSSRDRCTT